MGKLVVTEFISLDGVVEDPGGAESFRHGGWTFTFDRGEAGDRIKLDELKAAGAQLLGRVTYEGFAAAWPGMEAGEFGVLMNTMPKYVVSSTLERADWQNSSILRGDLGDEVRALKERYQGDILVAGSISLVQGLLRLGLVDVLRLMVFPVVLGSGRRLFGELAEPARLQLADEVTAGDTVVLTYTAGGD
jgi:dihydrofolate reductase